MRSRLFGATGVSVSEIGFGTWGFGGMWGPRDDGAAVEALNFALDLGVNFFDTAAVYGEGHSETLIGNVLRKRKRRDQSFIATKVPPKDFQWPAKAGSDVSKIFPGEWIRSFTEKSLKHLQTDVIDLQQLHVWAANWQNQGDWLQELQKLKQEGKIRFIGISLNDHEPDTGLELVRSGVVDSIQVIFNLFDQTPAERLLPLCREKNVAVIARVPFDEGGLTGTLTPETEFPKKDWRRHYFSGNRLKETCERAEKLKVFLKEEAQTLTELALRFCLSHPAVSTVIPGMRRREHVGKNCAVSDGKALSEKTLEALKTHAWQRNFYSWD